MCILSRPPPPHLLSCWNLDALVHGVRGSNELLGQACGGLEPAQTYEKPRDAIVLINHTTTFCFNVETIQCDDGRACAPWSASSRPAPPAPRPSSGGRTCRNRGGWHCRLSLVSGPDVRSTARLCGRSARVGTCVHHLPGTRPWCPASLTACAQAAACRCRSGRTA